MHTTQLYARESVAFDHELIVRDSNGQPVDISGWIFALQLQRQAGSIDIDLGAAAGGNQGIEVIDGIAGIIRVVITKASLQGIGDTTGEYRLFGDLIGTSPTGAQKIITPVQLEVTGAGMPFGDSGYQVVLEAVGASIVQNVREIADRAEAAASLINTGARMALALPDTQYEVLVYDGFKRADGAIGTADTGQAWSQVGTNANYQIVGSQMRNVSGSNLGRAIIDTKSSDMDVRVSYTPVNVGSNAVYVRTAPDAQTYALRFAFQDDQAFVDIGGENLGRVIRTKNGGNLPPDYDWTQPVSARLIVRGNLISIYTSTAGYTDWLFGKFLLSDDIMAAHGNRTLAGLYVRSTVGAKKFYVRTPLQTQERLTNLEGPAVIPPYHEEVMRELAEINAREADAEITLSLHTPQSLGYPALTGASDYFRGEINLPNGGGFRLARSSGYFLVRRPDGTEFPTTLGLDPSDFGDEVEWNMSMPRQGGPHIVCPPRGSAFVGVIEWRKLFHEDKVDQPGYALEKRTFGLNWDTSVADKFTSCEFAYNRYWVFYPTDYPAVLIWDTVTDKAWFDSFGINFQLGTGGKAQIGGCQGFTGDFFQVPFSGKFINRWNIITGERYQGDYDVDLENIDTATWGFNKWSSLTPAIDCGLWAGPRGSDRGILHIDEYNHASPVSIISHDQDGNRPNWGPNSKGGFGCNRFINLHNGNLLGGPNNDPNMIIVKPLQRSFTIKHFTDSVTGLPFDPDDLDHIGGIATPQSELSFAPSSSGKFLKGNVALSQPVPTRLLTNPVFNRAG